MYTLCRASQEGLIEGNAQQLLPDQGFGANCQSVKRFVNNLHGSIPHRRKLTW